jgi:MFS family permease
MKETVPLLKPQSKDFSTLFKSLYSETEFRLTIVLVFFSALVLNFSSTLLSIFYINVWQVNDNLAGIFLAMNCTQVLFILVPGMMIEKYGIKFTYMFGTSVTILTFLIILIENLIFHIILISLSFGFASTVLWGSLKASTTETTTSENRSLGFSMFNSAYNFSTIVLGLIYELVFYLNGINMDSYRIIISILILLFIFNMVLIGVFSKLTKSVVTSVSRVDVGEILNQKRYWKTLAVIILSAIPLGAAFFPGIVLPIYMDRELGSTTGYGLYFACYSFMLGVFSILFSFITNYMGLYDCIVVGGLITAAGPLVFTVGNDHITIGAYIFITAVGGSIIEPRIFDYNGFASVKGHEGFYYGIASIGYAFTAIFTGFLSGYLLDEYCPKNDERECWKMWTGLTCCCSVGIVLLVALKPILEVKRDHEELDPYVFSRHLS